MTKNGISGMVLKNCMTLPCLILILLIPVSGCYTLGPAMPNMRTAGNWVPTPWSTETRGERNLAAVSLSGHDIAFEDIDASAYRGGGVHLSLNQARDIKPWLYEHTGIETLASWKGGVIAGFFTPSADSGNSLPLTVIRPDFEIMTGLRLFNQGFFIQGRCGAEIAVEFGDYLEYRRTENEQDPGSGFANDLWYFYPVLKLDLGTGWEFKSGAFINAGLLLQVAYAASYAATQGTQNVYLTAGIDPLIFWMNWPLDDTWGQDHRKISAGVNFVILNRK